MGEQALNPTIQSLTTMRKQAIAQGLTQLRLTPIATDIEINRTDAIKLPLAQISSLGVGLATIPDCFRTVTQTIETHGGEILYRAIVPDGAALVQDKQGLFSSAAKMITNKAAKWTKYEAVNPATQTITTTVPFDPTTLTIAMALSQINQKLDGIQDTLNELFDYLRLKDKANIRASLETLSAILNDYKFNWNNDSFKAEKRNLIQSINRDALQHVIELRAQLSKKVKTKGLVELRGQASKSAEEVLELLKEYQLAVYLYSFSLFMDVMLLENYEAEYLQAKAADIEQKALEYRDFYTSCYEAIEGRAQGSLDTVLLSGVSAFTKGLGKAIANTRLGDVTQIDEALAGASQSIGGFNEEQSSRVAQHLAEAKDPHIAPFARSIEAVNRVYNEPSQILTDGKNVYLLPVDAD